VFLSDGPLIIYPDYPAESFFDVFLVFPKPYLVGGRLDQGGGSASSDIPSTIGDPGLGLSLFPTGRRPSASRLPVLLQSTRATRAVRPAQPPALLTIWGKLPTKWRQATLRASTATSWRWMNTDICGSGTADDDMLAWEECRILMTNDLPIGSEIVLHGHL
jgi:hypothetical protein